MNPLVLGMLLLLLFLLLAIDLLLLEGLVDDDG